MKKKGRGLSFDQKREKMLAIFHNTKDVFNYQQIEKLSIKAGIPFPSVKQVLNSLKGDSLVECQKIGSGVFYWSFPSKTKEILIDRIEFSEKQMETYEKQIGQLQENIEIAKQQREQTDERSQMLQDIESLQKQEKYLSKEVQKYIRFDPERYEFLKKENLNLKTEVNNETDNLEQIKKFIKGQQYGITNEEIQQVYEIPHDLDYIE